MADKNKLLVSTRKGLIVFERNASGKWRYDRAHFLGMPVSMAHVDA